MDADPTPLVDILSDTQMTVLKSESLDSNQSYCEIILDSENLESHQTSNIFIERSFIADTDFSNGRWTGLELIELLCRNCNAANVDWSGARMTDTEFHRTRLTGCNLSGTNLHNVLFYRCKLDLSLFHVKAHQTHQNHTTHNHNHDQDDKSNSRDEDHIDCAKCILS